MAATPNQAVELAKDCIQVATAIKSAAVLARQFVTNNNVNDPGWSSYDDNPPVSPTTGLIDTTEVTPGQVSNAIGSINNFLNYYTGASAVAQVAWGDNLETIVPAIV